MLPVYSMVDYGFDWPIVRIKITYVTPTETPQPGAGYRYSSLINFLLGYGASVGLDYGAGDGTGASNVY